MKPRNNVLILALSLSIFFATIALPGNLIQKGWADSASFELFLVAQKAFSDGFYDVAIRYIQELLGEYPHTERRIEARLLLGKCYFFKSQYLKAFDIFQELLQYTELKDATLFWLAETYLKGLDYQEAEEYYRRLIDGHPSSIYIPPAYYSLAWTYFEQKKYETANEIFSTFIEKFPKHELISDSILKIGECEYNSAAYNNAIERFRDYVLKFPKSDRHDQAYFYIGESYFYMENFSDAIIYYGKTAETSKGIKLILMSKISLGWSYLKLGDFEKSQEFFSDALAISVDNNIPSDDMLLGQATLYSAMNKHSESLITYDKLINEIPDSLRIIEAHLGKANALYSLGSYDESIKQSNFIINQFAEDTKSQEIIEKVYFNLAWSLLKKGDIDSAIQNFQKVFDMAKSKVVKVSALTQIGDIYQSNGNLAKSLEIYDKILNDFPESLYTDYVQYRQGIVFLKMERIESATLVFQSLQANYPKSKYVNDSKYYLGLAYFKKGDWTASKEELTNFINALPKTHEFQADAHYLLGLSMFNLNKAEDAIRIFRKIAKNYPDRTSLVKDSEINVAKCLYSLENDKEALKKFKIIIYKYPETETALESLLWLGDYYLKNSDYDNVSLYYQQLIEQFPGSDKIYIARHGLGHAYQQQGLFDKALNQYKLIDYASDRELYAKAQLAIANIFSKNTTPEKAIETYRNVTESCPEFIRDALVRIAQIYQDNHDYEKAIEAYSQALLVDTGLSKIKKVELQFYIADTYELLNKPNEAVAAYFKIPSLYGKETPWVTKAYLRMARIFEDREDWKNAKLAYNKIIERKTEEAKFAQERIDWINNNIESIRK